jgi:hypothetical protein
MERRHYRSQGISSRAARVAGIAGIAATVATGLAGEYLYLGANNMPQGQEGATSSIYSPQNLKNAAELAWTEDAVLAAFSVAALRIAGPRRRR